MHIFIFMPSLNNELPKLKLEEIMNYNLDHLRELESEAIYVLRETAAQFERPALLFSGGKDSIVITHLPRKAFYPAKFHFP